MQPRQGRNYEVSTLIQGKVGRITSRKWAMSKWSHYLWTSNALGQPTSPGCDAQGQKKKDETHLCTLLVIAAARQGGRGVFAGDSHKDVGSIVVALGDVVVRFRGLAGGVILSVVGVAALESTQRAVSRVVRLILVSIVVVAG